MPKGDRLKLKADPEDGTTPIANLLLEAVAMAKISGLQKGAILHLWRVTYGWIENGKRIKERKITLQEWMKALDSSKSRTSEALAELEQKGIMFRRMTDMWGGYYYSINTDVSKWNSNSVNLSKLAEQVGIPNFGTVAQNGTVPNSNNSSDNENSTDKRNGTVAQNGTEQLPKTELPTLYKEILNKDKEINADNFSEDNIVRVKTDDEGNELPPPKQKKIKESGKYGNELGVIFKFLDETRGYRLPKRNAEAASIIRMLKRGYSVEQIKDTWKIMKSELFWSDKELLMPSLETQIGAKLAKPKVNGEGLFQK